MLFGGIQVIGSGSFFQLPPVPSSTDPGHYAFAADVFGHVFPHKLNLKQVMRQKEPEFIQAINELCEGSLTPASEELLKSLDRPLADMNDAIHIFGRNIDVDFFNYEQLDALPGVARLYKCTDDGDSKYLRRCSAPNTLALKLNCKVLITRNLHSGLVNGMAGTVVALDDEEISVKIDADKYIGHMYGGQTFNIGKYTFTVRDGNNKVVAVRKQFPLRLGYALTVDKAQGRTIENLVVDAYNFWRPGQFGVAIGRAVHTKGLQIQNFNANASMLQHPPEVYQFYHNKSKTIKQDKSCCKPMVRDLELARMTDENAQIIDTHFLGDADQEVFNFPERAAVRARRPKQYPHDVCKLIRGLLIPNAIEELHATRNEIVGQLLDDKRFHNFIHQQFGELHHLLQQHQQAVKKRQCNWCQMCKHLHQYMCSSTYVQQCCKAFDTSALTALQNQLCTDVLFAMLESIVQACKHDKLEAIYSALDSDTSSVDVENIDVDTKRTLRYIAGATIHHVCLKLERHIHNKLLQKCYGDRGKLRAFRLINQLRIPESTALSTCSDQDSLQETVRRQGATSGLTHVTDGAFNFFKVVYQKMRKWQCERLVKLDPNNVHQKAIKKLKEDHELLDLWLALFNQIEEYQVGVQQSVEDKECDWLKVELEQALILNMFDLAMTYIAQTHLSDILGQLKETLNWKRGKSLRSSVWSAKKKSDIIDKVVEYPCGTCGKECIDESVALAFEDQSVLCEKCEKWFHFVCVGLTGKESFLKKKSTAAYFCKSCDPAVQSADAVKTRVCHNRASARGGKVVPQAARGRKTQNKRQLSESDEVVPVNEPVASSRGRIRKKPSRLDL